MPQTYYAKLTPVGEAKLANAIALGTQLEIAQMGVGDCNGAALTPEQILAAPASANERRRAALNRLDTDPLNAAQVIAEQVIPEDVGGWYIRALMLYDVAGDLVAVANCPDTYKPVLAEGSGRTQVIRMVLVVGSTAAVQLKIDPAVVLATRTYVDDKVLDELNKRDAKQSVRVATTAAIALNGLQNIDGVALVAGDRVLVKDQAAGAENGIYVAAAGAWSRAADADSGTKLTAGATVPVEAGTTNADTIWMVKTDGAIIVGATAIAFQWAGGLNAPTQPVGDNSAKLANTAHVQAAIAALLGGVGGALDTLNELAAALGNDANFAATVANALALKAPLASPALTGVPTAPTAALGTNTTQLATMAALIAGLYTGKGVQRFVANGNFTVPAGVTTIYVSGCGGGGGGGGARPVSSNNCGGAGGGGAGQSAIRVPLAVVPGQVIAITVGGSGVGGAISNSGTAGGASSVGALLTLNGGQGGSVSGAVGAASLGGNGGSGSPDGTAGSDASATIGTGAGGAGGSTPFGGGGGGGKSTSSGSSAGSSGNGYGAGGGGAGGSTNSVGTSSGNTGGHGAPGLIIIEW